VNCRALRVLTPTLLLLSLAGGWAVAYGQEMFKLLGEKDIRARVIDKDMTDSSHWVSYFRSDGALLSNEMGRKWAGTWKIQNNKLCMSIPKLESLDCNEVWISGANVRLRANKDAETFDALLENHKAD
jgi:hypothetical protein